jgi:hypothetical protein
MKLLRAIRLWLPVLTLVGAAFGFYLQFKAIRESNQAFVDRLEADHRERQLEISLGFWDSWENALSQPNVRDDVKKLAKWTAPLSNTGSNMSKNDRDEYDKWLSLFAKGSSTPSSDFEPMLAKIPSSISSCFLSGSTTQPLTISDVDRIRGSTIRLINVMEKIAVAYKFNIAERKTLDEGFKSSISRRTKELLPFIVKFRDCESPGAWLPLTELVTVGDWNEINGKEKPRDVRAPFTEILNKH